jgi:hypothetical protein
MTALLVASTSVTVSTGGSAGTGHRTINKNRPTVSTMVTIPTTHSASANASSLVCSLVDPFLDEVEAELTANAAKGGVPREFLAGHFDLFARHRQVIQLLLRV